MIKKRKEIKNQKIKKHKKQKAFKDDVQKIVNKAKEIILPKINDDHDALEKKTSQLDENCNDKQVKKITSEASISFFYTNDKYFVQVNDAELILSIQQKYPRFMDDSVEDSEMKKIIIQIIQDKNFVIDLLDSFNMNLYDFFKFIFRTNLAIFKGPYLNKLQRILVDNQYIV